MSIPRCSGGVARRPDLDRRRLGHEEQDWIDGYNRTQSARKVIEAVENTVVVRQVDWAAPEDDVAFMQEALTSADPPAVGMIGLFSNAYLGVDAAISPEMENDLEIAAFDFEDQTLAYVEPGLIKVTHAQRQ